MRVMCACACVRVMCACVCVCSWRCASMCLQVDVCVRREAFCAPASALHSFSFPPSLSLLLRRATRRTAHSAKRQTATASATQRRHGRASATRLSFSLLRPLLFLPHLSAAQRAQQHSAPCGSARVRPVARGRRRAYLKVSLSLVSSSCGSFTSATLMVR